MPASATAISHAALRVARRNFCTPDASSGVSRIARNEGEVSLLLRVLPRQ